MVRMINTQICGSSGGKVGEVKGNPLQYSCLENPMDRGAWQATVHGVARVGNDLVTKSSSSAGKESTCNAGDSSSIPGSGSSPGGYPLQYSQASLVAHRVKNPPAMWETWVQSLGWEDPLEKRKATHSSNSGLENPIDRGAWWVTVHEAAKSWTQLST